MLLACVTNDWACPRHAPGRWWWSIVLWLWFQAEKSIATKRKLESPTLYKQTSLQQLELFTTPPSPPPPPPPSMFSTVSLTRECKQTSPVILIIWGECLPMIFCHITIVVNSTLRMIEMIPMLMLHQPVTTHATPVVFLILLIPMGTSDAPLSLINFLWNNGNYLQKVHKCGECINPSCTPNPPHDSQKYIIH